MANKKISELAVRTPSLTDLMLVGDPSTGYSYKATISSLSTLLEANIALDDLNDVTITSPTAGQVLSYNGTAWVNDTNGITGTGTTNYVPKFTSSSAIGNSIIYDDGASPYQRVGIATTSLDSRFLVKGIDNTSANTTIKAIDNSDNALFYVRNDGNLFVKSNLGLNTASPDLFSRGYAGPILGMTTSSGNVGIEMNSASGSSSFIDMGNGGGRTFSIAANPTSTVFQGVGAFPMIFQTNSSEVMRLDASGNLGLGTTLPSSFSGYTTLSINNATNGGIMELMVNGSVYGRFFTSSTQYIGLGSVANVPLLFLTNDTERMRITSGGNVGIGTSSPQTQLDIANGLMFGTIDAFPSATYDAAAVIAKTGSLGSAPFNNAGSIVYRARVTSTAGRSSHIFYTGSPSTERMRLDESGNLGLGTSSPTALLDVRGTGASTDFRLSRNIDPNIYLSINAPGNTPNRSTFGINGTNVMTLNASGNVGIGTTTPQSILDITAATPIMTISANTNTVLHGIEWKSGTSLDAFIKQQPNTGEFRISNGRSAVWGGIITFYTDISERMRITSVGNVGIGTTTPNQRLTVGVAQTANTVMPVLKLTTTGAYSGAGSSDAGASVEFGQYHDTYPNWVLGQISAIRSGASWDGALLFYTNNGTAETNKTERMRLNSSGNLGLGVTPSAWISTYRALQIGFGSSIVGRTDNTTFYQLNNAYRAADGTNYYLRSGETATQFAANLSGQYIWYQAPSGTAGNAISFTQAMTLDASGNLLVATTSPSYNASGRGNITIGGSSSSILGLQVGGVAKGYVYHDNVNYGLWNTANGYMGFGTNDTERMRITSGGNVGIGSTSPAQQLEIKGAAGANTTIQITSNNSNDFSSRIFFADNVSQRGYIAYSNFSNFLAFGTNSSEVARFTSAGELLINTTTDAGDFKLQVSGNAYVSGSVGIGSTSTSNGLLTIAGTAPRAINMAATFTGGTSRFGILQNNTVNSDVTSSAVNNYSQFATQAAAFTLTTASHYTIAGITIGAGSSVTNQIGYRATNITEATNNYGFYGEIASGTGRWNLYMAGTANNYMNGNLGIGVTTPTEKLEVNGAIKTAAPSGGTAKPFKIGAAATVTPTSQNRTIEIEIDGTTYYLTAKTTND